MDAVSALPAILPTPGLASGQGLSAQSAPDAVAKAFESVFVTLMLKQMRQTLDGDSMFPGDKSEVLGGLFDHYMGEHIAKAGGLGIGAMIRTQMERQGQRRTA